MGLSFDVAYVAEHLMGMEILSCEDEWQVRARCPYCRDKRYRMYISLAPENWTYHCFNCGTDGNALTLYADHNPYGAVSTKEAYETLKRNEAVPRTGRHTTNSKDSRNAGQPREKVMPNMKPLWERHQVYAALLDLCRLEDRHRKNLNARGLPDEIICRNGYKSVPAHEERIRIAAELAGRYDLAGIPGFFTKDCCWTMLNYPGFFIPVRDEGNRIQGLQIRLDHPFRDKRKYVWFATRRYENGTGIIGFIHIAGDRSRTTLNLTEGGLKSDVASYLSGGALFGGMPGVTNRRLLKQLLLDMKPSCVNNCVDMDIRTNPQVYTALLEIRKIVMPLCPEYRELYWPAQKGIDDFFLMGTRQPVTVQTYSGEVPSFGCAA